MSLLEISNGLISAYSKFKKEVFTPTSVLYPSCGFDASPSEVFDNVTYVDLEDGNDGCIDELRAAGLNAIKGDIKNYKPQNLHDLLILLNPSIPPEWATPCVIQGGYIIANNYHQTARELFNMKDSFSLEGGLSESVDKPTFTRKTVGMFDPIRTAAEKREIGPDRYETDLQMLRLDARIYGINESSLNDEELWAECLKKAPRCIPSRKGADLYVLRKK